MSKLFDINPQAHMMQVDAFAAHELAEKLQRHLKTEHGDAPVGDMLIALLLCAEACAGTVSKAPWLTLRGAVDTLEEATSEDYEAPLPEAKA